MKKDRVASSFRALFKLVAVLSFTFGLMGAGLLLAAPAGATPASVPAVAEPAPVRATAAAAAPAAVPIAAQPTLSPAAAGDFVFTGLGWGHAVGMSQWGAWYAARIGTSFGDILAFYYPGTTLAPLADPDTVVKVKISSEPWKSVSSITQDYAQVDLEPTVAPMTLLEHSASAGDTTEDVPLGGKVTVTNVGGKVMVVTPAGSEGPYDYVEARPAAATQPPVSPGDSSQAADDEPTPDGRVKITLWTSATTHVTAREYWGNMRVQYSSAAGKLWVYNYVPIDKYVRSIAEVEYDWAMP